jgi:hypothetical protein
MSQSSSSAPPDDYLPENWRKVRFRHSPSFVDILGELGCSLLVSTYQAGKLVAIGVVDDALEFSFHSVEQAMGIAVSPQRIAVGTKGHIWFFQNNSQLAPSIAPAGKYDGCYLARTAHATGGIHCHEMAWVVNWLKSSGSSTRCSLAWRRCMMISASYHAGGRLSLRSWREKTGATSTAWRCKTVGRAT